MNLLMISYLLGWILLCVAALMVLPLGTGILYHEPATCYAFLVTIVVSALLGYLLVRRKPQNKIFYMKEGFVITALSWVVISVVGAVPFVLTGSIPNPVDALFETVSGFTTTGASILNDVECLSHGILLWRSFTHWIGGMGVLVFLLVLLPLTGASGSQMNLMKAESPGPQVEKLVPKVQSTAAILYGIYLALTVTEMVLLFVTGMPLFDAITLSFGTAGTGGFGVRNDSITSYAPHLQNIITVFMILFGINFNFYFLLLLRKFKKAFAVEEVRCYLGVIGAAVLVITWNIRHLYPSILTAFQQAAFQVGSIITTTGYSTADFDVWPNLSRTLLVLLMFVGACAGSTGGGMKVSRFIILIKEAKRELHTFLHPKSVRKISMDGRTIAQDTLRSTNVYVIVYVLLFVVSLLLITVDNFDVTTNFTAVAATLNNIGPGLELVGPTQNFSIFSNFSKLVLTFDMLAGRLELFPVLVLFTRETWEKF